MLPSHLRITEQVSPTDFTELTWLSYDYFSVYKEVMKRKAVLCYLRRLPYWGLLWHHKPKHYLGDSYMNGFEHCTAAVPSDLPHRTFLTTPGCWAYRSFFCNYWEEGEWAHAVDVLLATELCTSTLAQWAGVMRQGCSPLFRCPWQPHLQFNHLTSLESKGVASQAKSLSPGLEKLRYLC